MKYFKLVVLASLLFTIKTTVIQAVGLKTAPLLYNETLLENEKKKGFIDVMNPTDQPVVVQTEVQAFRQTNNNGDLAFYDKPEYQRGITFDYTNFRLESREALRLYFLLDSAKLPGGGIAAVLFFKTVPEGANPDNTSVQPVARVGTLLIVENGGGAQKQAEVTDIKAPFFQIGKNVKASATLKNTGGENGLAFFPNIQSKVEPFGTTSRVQSSLIFPGISRETPLQLSGSYFGLVRLRVTTGVSTKYRWSFVATGHGRWIGPLLIVLSVGIAGGLVELRKLRRKTED